MKKIFVLAAAMACAYSAAFGQGQVVFNNRVTGTQTTGPQAVVDAKVLNVGGINNLIGTGFTIELWGGSSEANLALVPNSTTTFRTSTTGAGYVLAGITVNVPGVAAGETAALQVRAWDNNGGTVTSWAAALASGRAFGSSPTLTSFPLGGGTVQPPNLVGLQGFTLAVPEPSTFAFAGLGLLGLVMARRKK